VVNDIIIATMLPIPQEPIPQPQPRLRFFPLSSIMILSLNYLPFYCILYRFASKSLNTGMLNSTFPLPVSDMMPRSISLRL
jgi:hypothetical protein